MGYCRLSQKVVILSLTTLAGVSNSAHLGGTWNPPIHGLYTFVAETNDSPDWGLPRPTERHHHWTMIQNATERRLLTSSSTFLDVWMDAMYTRSFPYDDLSEDTIQDAMISLSYLVRICYSGGKLQVPAHIASLIRANQM